MSRFKVFIIALAVTFVLFCCSISSLAQSNSDVFYRIVSAVASRELKDTDREIARHIEQAIDVQYGFAVTIDKVSYVKGTKLLGIISKEDSIKHERYAFEGVIKGTDDKFTGVCWADYTNLFSADLSMLDRRDYR